LFPRWKGKTYVRTSPNQPIREGLHVFRNKKQTSANQKQRHLITKFNPKSPISEQYRTIRTNLQFSSVDEDLQSIFVTSAGPATGKSITAANLAGTYAQQGLNTVLVAADLRKPTVHYTF